MSIWKFEEISKNIDKKYRLSLGEGGTPLEKIYMNSKELALFGIREKETYRVYFKLETHNPNKSFKDRSLAYQISYYKSVGARKLLISSSGNAAISAASYVGLAPDVELAIFMSVNANPEKVRKINELAERYPNVVVNYSRKPKSDAMKFSNYGSYVNLRGSQDRNAVSGFKTISYELASQIPDADAVFIPCSSGTSTVGIYEGYRDLERKPPQLHISQSEKICPISKEYDVIFTKSDSSLADAISDRVAHRKQEVMSMIDETGGFGWIIDDALLEKSVKYLQEKTSFKDLTYNGILSFAALMKSMKQKRRFGKPVCIISGI
ncbi:pyridoxal-phosphate dependent enzyme [Candidatus Dojkabacteria bacterium]|nr:pyridoxal-phosphate dependent enzyme [Candidatus Dojkabacteria bacterium]